MSNASVSLPWVGDWPEINLFVVADSSSMSDALAQSILQILGRAERSKGLDVRQCSKQSFERFLVRGSRTMLH